MGLSIHSDDSRILVKPNATKEEIEKMVDGEQGQLFAKQVGHMH